MHESCQLPTMVLVVSDPRRGASEKWCARTIKWFFFLFGNRNSLNQHVVLFPVKHKKMELNTAGVRNHYLPHAGSGSRGATCQDLGAQSCCCCWNLFFSNISGCVLLAVVPVRAGGALRAAPGCRWCSVQMKMNVLKRFRNSDFTFLTAKAGSCITSALNGGTADTWLTDGECGNM